MKPEQPWKQRQPKVEYKGEQKHEAQDMRRSSEPPKKKNPLAEIIGQIITIQSKSGIIFTGKMTQAEGGFVKLIDAEVAGQQYKVNAPWVLVERTAIAHIHPGNLALAKIE